MFELNTLLVPVDFSPTSRAAFDRALQFVNGEKPVIILLHVLDPTLADFADAHGFGSKDNVLDEMRRVAEETLDEYRQEARQAKPEVEIETIICEGLPFMEIVKKANDLQVHAIVMGKLGSRGTAESLLFGSTAERVIRGAARPVIVLPSEPSE